MSPGRFTFAREVECVFCTRPFLLAKVVHCLVLPLFGGGLPLSSVTLKFRLPTNLRILEEPTVNQFFDKSDYKRNLNQDDIVYYSEAMDAYLRVTKEQFLADNPNLTEQDFAFYKRWSDQELLELCNHDRNEGRRHCPIHEEWSEQLADNTMWMDYSDTTVAMGSVLTPTQYRRFMLHAVYGLTTVEIAQLEGCAQQVISRSIALSRGILKKYFSRGV